MVTVVTQHASPSYLINYSQRNTLLAINSRGHTLRVLNWGTSYFNSFKALPLAMLFKLNHV